VAATTCVKIRIFWDEALSSLVDRYQYSEDPAASKFRVEKQRMAEKYSSETLVYNIPHYIVQSGPGSSVGIATDYGLDGPGIESRWDEIFRACADRPWSPPSLLYNEYRVFPGGKVRPGRAADHPSPSSAQVTEE
jgi:hypothetical protein